MVVTIIVLLILAGVALSLTIGDNGIISRTKLATNEWKNSATNEQEALAELEGLIDNYENGGIYDSEEKYNTASTVIEAIEQNKQFEKDTEIKDDLNNIVKIPAGFKVSQESETKVEDGIVIEDKDQNQFVWIPVSTSKYPEIYTSLGNKTITYTRTDFKHQDGIFKNYSETMPGEEEESVNANGGYYIGRFEVGDANSTKFRTGETEGKIVIKSGQVPYNYISQENAKIKAEALGTEQGYGKSFTKLVSSYAWDTAINFIQIKNNEYATNPQKGNYNNVEFDYANLGETEKNSHKEINVPKLVPTGQSEKASNIYEKYKCGRF